MLSRHANEVDTPLAPADADTSEIYDAVAENFLMEVRFSLEDQNPTHPLASQRTESH